MRVTVGRTLLDVTNQTFINVRSVNMEGPRPLDHWSRMEIELKDGVSFYCVAYTMNPYRIVAVEDEYDEIGGFAIEYTSVPVYESTVLHHCKTVQIFEDTIHNPALHFEQYCVGGSPPIHADHFDGRYRIVQAYLLARSPDPAVQNVVASEPEKLPLRRILLKGDNPFAGLRYLWTGDPKRLGRCSVRLDEFCARCCPGGIDGRCWFAEGKVVPWAPPEVARCIVRQERPEAPSDSPGTGRKLILKGGSP